MILVKEILKLIYLNAVGTDKYDMSLYVFLCLYSKFLYDM